MKNRNRARRIAPNRGEVARRLMRDILARWNEFSRDSEIKKMPNILAAAAEIELAKYQAGRCGS
jgi:hypothetical protein